MQCNLFLNTYLSIFISGYYKESRYVTVIANPPDKRRSCGYTLKANPFDDLGGLRGLTSPVLLPKKSYRGINPTLSFPGVKSKTSPFNLFKKFPPIILGILNFRSTEKGSSVVGRKVGSRNSPRG